MVQTKGQFTVKFINCFFVYTIIDSNLTNLSLTSLYLIQPEKYSWLFLKLADRKQLATQGVSGRQVHKGVAGASQRRGRVASPVGIGSGLKISGKSLAVCKTPPAGRNAPAPPVYSCALFQRGSPRADALEASQGRSRPVSFASKLPFPAKICSMS